MDSSEELQFSFDPDQSDLDWEGSDKPKLRGTPKRGEVSRQQRENRKQVNRLLEREDNGDDL